MFFGFLIIYVFWIKIEKVDKRLTFPGFFLEKANFSESVLCHCEMFDWTIFGLGIGVCIVHAVIFINKYLVNMFTISFIDFFKILIMLILTMMKNYASFLFDRPGVAGAVLQTPL